MSLYVTDADAIAAFAKDVVAKHPDLNILVNNAGIMGAEDASAKRDLTHAEATVITNILGPIRLTDALVDHLTAPTDSAIVNVTSGLAFVPYPKQTTSSATRAAMNSHSVALHIQCATTNGRG